MLYMNLTSDMEYSRTHHLRLVRITDLVRCKFSPLKSFLESVLTVTIVLDATFAATLVLNCLIVLKLILV